MNSNDINNFFLKAFESFRKSFTYATEKIVQNSIKLSTFVVRDKTTMIISSILVLVLVSIGVVLLSRPVDVKHQKHDESQCDDHKTTERNTAESAVKKSLNNEALKSEIVKIEQENNNASSKKDSTLIETILDSTGKFLCVKCRELRKNYVKPFDFKKLESLEGQISLLRQHLNTVHATLNKGVLTLNDRQKTLKDYTDSTKELQEAEEKLRDLQKQRPSNSCYYTAVALRIFTGFTLFYSLCFEIILPRIVLVCDILSLNKGTLVNEKSKQIGYCTIILSSLNPFAGLKNQNEYCLKNIKSCNAKVAQVYLGDSINAKFNDNFDRKSPTDMPKGTILAAVPADAEAAAPADAEKGGKAGSDDDKKHDDDAAVPAPAGNGAEGSKPEETKQSSGSQHSKPDSWHSNVHTSDNSYNRALTAITDWLNLNKSLFSFITVHGNDKDKTASSKLWFWYHVVQDPKDTHKFFYEFNGISTTSEEGPTRGMKLPQLKNIDTKNYVAGKKSRTSFLDNLAELHGRQQLGDLRARMDAISTKAKADHQGQKAFAIPVYGYSKSNYFTHISLEKFHRSILGELLVKIFGLVSSTLTQIYQIFKVLVVTPCVDLKILACSAERAITSLL